MWIFTTAGFLSIVQHMDIPTHFQVRARAFEPLERFWPEHDIEVIDWADYRFRITISKEEVVPVIIETIRSVGYTSFKNQCEKDDDYHHALVRVWSVMHHYQTSTEEAGTPILPLLGKYRRAKERGRP